MTDPLDELTLADQSADWDTMESLARQWLARQRFFVPHLFLIQALVHTRRFDEADREFADLMSYKFNLADRMSRFPVLQLRYHDRLAGHYVLSTMRPGISFEVQAMPSGTRRWDLLHSTTSRAEFLAEARQVLDAALPPREPAPRARSAICTFGSCFAANLARMMVAQGMDASNLLIEESINSTLANRVLLEVVCGIEGGQAHADIRAEFGEAFFDTVRRKVAGATHIVLTVGVAPSFFDVETGDFVFAKRYGELLKSGRIRMRTTTCSENVGHIRAIVALMDRVAPNAQKIITVSPVPLDATAEMASVVVADCVSKSTLRAAVHEVVSADPALTYFPAFEIVRWLAGYTRTEVYGADDQNSRHVSNWVVEFLAGSFIERFFRARDPADA